MDKIIVLFKTHLDVGFTDFSRNVVDKYNKIYIPQAIRVSEELAVTGCKEGFTWTTGSWLIDQYRRQASAEELAVFDKAVQKKWIRWHGLPTTMHCEVADESLFRYGLSISKKLDKEFGVKTIAGKFTDVPGHTRAIIPLLFDAGIEFLHIGVNPASTAPDVPMYFRWQDPAGKEITVMYNKGDYGEFSVIPGTKTAVYFAHTGDNKGPSSAEHILSVYRKLHEEYPGAEVVAGDLNDVALALRDVKSSLPVIRQELGDTWIHGAGTDPKKLSQFRAMLRLARTASEDEREAMYRFLIMVPEHTWGLDEKTWLKDLENFSREAFYTARSEARYKNMEASWAEQRAYVTSAADALPDGKTKDTAMQLLGENAVPRPDYAVMQKLNGTSAVLGGGADKWTVAWDETGAIVSLVKNGRVYADEDHPLAKFRYDAFTEEEVNAYRDRYLKPHMRAESWAVHDFGKVGLQKDMPAHCAAEPVLNGAYMRDDTLVLHLTVAGDATDKYGCPPDMALMLRADDESGAMLFDFAWFGKPACRIPEALWLGFNPVKPLTAIRKLGSDIHPLEVISLGNREMHATEGTLTFDDMTLTLIDSALIAVEKPSVYAFYNKYPDTTKGIWANLFNNQWGTNFPMWNEGDARFRFVLQ